VLSGKQMSVNLPIASTGSNLRADVKDVRAEFRDDALNLSVIYAFSGAGSPPPVPPTPWLSNEMN
ncbi:MAG: hypothetical protein ABIV48_11940, partial [Pyrinomonadaceae bacterium]